MKQLPHSHALSHYLVKPHPSNWDVHVYLFYFYLRMCIEIGKYRQFFGNWHRLNMPNSSNIPSFSIFFLLDHFMFVFFTS